MAKPRPKQRPAKHKAKTVIRCHYCPNTTDLEPSAARFKGWRMYNGESVTGAHVEDVICPDHRRSTREDPIVKMAGQMGLW